MASFGMGDYRRRNCTRNRHDMVWICVVSIVGCMLIVLSGCSFSTHRVTTTTAPQNQTNETALDEKSSAESEQELIELLKEMIEQERRIK